MSQVKGKIVSSSTSSLEQRGSGREGIGGVVNEIKVTNLLKFTNYSIEVRAFNRKSPGMPSKAIYCRTSDDGKTLLLYSPFQALWSYRREERKKEAENEMRREKREEGMD